MSLEDEIRRNTEAMEKLTAAILCAGSGKSTEMPKIEVAEVKLPGKTYAEAAALPPEEAAVSAEIREQIEWDTIVTALTQHVQTKGRASAVAVMVAHGIQGKLTREQLGEDDYAKFYAALTA